MGKYVYLIEILQRSIYHKSIENELNPIKELMRDVRKKALMRLEYEGCPSNYEDPSTYAMEKYAYYVCFKCKKVISHFNPVASGKAPPARNLLFLIR